MTSPKYLAPLLLVVACHSAPPRSMGCLEPTTSHLGPALAYVGDVPVTRERIEGRLQALGQNRHSHDTLTGLRRLIEDEARFELLAQAAHERGLWRDPEVVDTARRVMVRKLLQNEFEGGPGQGSDMAREAQAYYKKHRDAYTQPEARRIEHVQLPYTPKGKLAAQEVLVAVQRDKVPGHLSLLQKKYPLARASALPSPTNYLTEVQMAEVFGGSFTRLAFSAPVGGVSPQLWESSQGWHVVRVLGKRDSLVRDFDEVRDQIVEKLSHQGKNERFSNYVEELRQVHPVSLDEVAIKGLIAEWMNPTP